MVLTHHDLADEILNEPRRVSVFDEGNAWSCNGTSANSLRAAKQQAKTHASEDAQPIAMQRCGGGFRILRKRIGD